MKTKKLLKKFIESAPEGKYIDADVPALCARTFSQGNGVSKLHPNLIYLKSKLPKAHLKCID